MNWDTLLFQIQEAIKPTISDEFNINKLFLYLDNQFVSCDTHSINQLLKNDIKEIYYIDIVALNNAKHLPVTCKAKNGSDIIFDIFPKEQPHRYLPHVMASCGGETIRIEFKSSTKILGKQHFSGNNTPNEIIAIRFVDENKEYFMAEWNRLVESQYN